MQNDSVPATRTALLADGTTIAYGATEGSAGEPIVLLHGYCGSRRYWDDVLPQLAQAGPVIAADLPGHGESSAWDGVYTMEKLAAATAGLLDALKLGRVRLFGHSLGGYIALAFAEAYPRRLSSLALVHSTPLADTGAARENRLKAADTIRSEGVGIFVDGLVPKLFAPRNRTAMPERLARAVRIGCGTSQEGAAGCALGMRERPDRSAVLEQSAVPVLLLAGAEDEVIPPERRFPVAAPHIRPVTLQRVGHMGMLEDPRAFVGAILNFMRQ